MARRGESTIFQTLSYSQYHKAHLNKTVDMMVQLFILYLKAHKYQLSQALLLKIISTITH